MKPHETVNNSTFQGPIDMVYFLPIDNRGGYYDKTLVVTVNSKLNVTGFDNDPSRNARSEVIFYDGNVQIILVSLGQPLSSLTQIAESLQ